MAAAATDGFGAVLRLIDLARSDTGQSVRVRQFLLAWWNADELGRWDPRDLWEVDAAIAEDMLTTLRFIAKVRCYPDSLGLGVHFAELVALATKRRRRARSAAA